MQIAAPPDQATTAAATDVRVNPHDLYASGASLYVPGPGSVHATQTFPGSVPGPSVPSAAVPPSSASPSIQGPPPDPAAWRGLIINLPPPSNTIDLGADGLRQKLYDDYGIGYIGLVSANFYDNVLRHNHHGAQSYIGQKPTVIDQNFAAVTLDLSRYGIPDGQIVAEGTYETTSYNNAGPTTLNLGTFSYFQTVFNKRLDVKVGLLGNSFEYVGVFTAGSLNAGVFGPGSQLSGEAGLSAVLFPSYGINLTAHITRNWYDKFGVARSTSAQGIVPEHNNNPTGLNFQTPESGAYVIDEVGYREQPSPGGWATWARAGGSYSASHYAELDHVGRDSNKEYFVYALLDQQILKVSRKPGESYRGLYAGFSVEYDPQNLNAFSQYYEARVFGLGLLPGRPFDQTSLVFTNNVFSQFLIDRLKSVHQLTHDSSKAITGSYSFQVVHGVYLNAGLAYIDNPTFPTYTRSSGSALNVIGGASVYF